MSGLNSENLTQKRPNRWGILTQARDSSKSSVLRGTVSSNATGECPDKFVVVSQGHLNSINREFQHWYNHERPHFARDHFPELHDSDHSWLSTMQIEHSVILSFVKLSSTFVTCASRTPLR